jgi:hypothetical protein
MRERSRWRPIVQDRIRSQLTAHHVVCTRMYPTKRPSNSRWKVTVAVHVDGCNQIDQHTSEVHTSVYMYTLCVINHDFNGRSSRWYVSCNLFVVECIRSPSVARCKRDTWILDRVHNAYGTTCRDDIEKKYEYTLLGRGLCTSIRTFSQAVATAMPRI